MNQMEQKQPRMRPPPVQYNGSRMDEYLGGQVGKEYQKPQNYPLSQTLLQNPRQNQNQFPDIIDKMTQSDNQRIQITNQQRSQPMESNQDRFTAQVQREKFALNQRPASYHPPQENQMGGGEQDKVIHYLMDQVQGLSNEAKRTSRIMQDLEREMRSTQNRSNDQPNIQIINDMENKLYSFEGKFLREEKSKNDLQQRIVQQDQSIKEIMYLMKNSQSKDTNDMLQMRGMIQEKITDEGVSLQKEREKSKALFMEVVRLGEGQERQSESMTSITVQYEQRIQAIEGKIYSGEKALVQVAQKGDSGINYINDWNDKLERRVMMLESNILTLGKEQLKDRDQLAKVDGMTQRLSDDLKQMIHNVQQDYQSRLEARSTELINRIVMEHEQRVKQYDEMRSSFDMREKLNNERQQYEREEMRERLSSLEQVLRTDSQRKEEAIRQLSTLIESQVAAIYSNIKNEEASRYAHEIALRNDLLKIQENIKQENDMFKNHQSTITEKMTDMIRVEVQNRLSSDVDLKNLTSAIAQDIVADLNSLKDTIESQNKQILVQLRDIERDSSEKAQRLSLYVDDEVTKLSLSSGKKYEKMKIIFTKLAEQFKQHLINTEQNRQEIDKRVKFLEINIESVRGDFQGVLDELQEHLLTRIAEDKNQIITQSSNAIKIVEDKTNKLQEEQNKNFEIMKVAIQENHTVFTEQMKLILDQNELYHKETRVQIELIVKGVSAVRESIQKLEQQLKDQLILIQKQVDDQKIDIKTIQDNQAIHDQRLITINQQIDDQNAKLTLLNKEFEDFDQSLKQYNDQFNQVKDEQQKIKDQLSLIQQTQEKLNDNQKLIVQSLEKLQDTQAEQTQEIEAQKAKNLQLSDADLNLKTFITDEVQAQQNQDRENAKKIQTTLSDRIVAVETQDKKRDLQTDDIKENIVLLQDKIKTLTKLEN